MPLYDLVCILRATAPRKAVAEVLRRAATTVLDANGVVTDIKNYGTRALAYDIKRSGELHSQGQYVQLSFATSPKTLSWMEHNLRTDERVVRHVVVKHRKLTKLPNQHELQRLADKRLEAQLAAQTKSASAAEQPQQPAPAAAASQAKAKG